MSEKNTQKANLSGVAQDVTKVRLETGLLTPDSVLSELSFLRQLQLWPKFFKWVYVLWLITNFGSQMCEMSSL